MFLLILLCQHNIQIYGETNEHNYGQHCHWHLWTQKVNFIAEYFCEFEFEKAKIELLDEKQGRPKISWQGPFKRAKLGDFILLGEVLMFQNLNLIN
jgi:hypothetical protein